ncbi:MAG: DUF4390 domain-containing protein [Nitrospirae bacterium]|nr:DUF4390 domain-containing protein [Nitrospirota bacterium]
MARHLLIIIFSVSFILTTSPAIANILGPEIKIQDNNIIVNTGFFSTKEIETAMNSGIEKEIIFSIELFRVFSFWPDDLVVRKKIQNIIKYDNLRGQYHLSSYDGTTLKEKIFKDSNTLKERSLTVKDVNLANVRELERGKYLVRVVVESKSRELPPLIGFFMLFIPETETSFIKKSPPFTIGKKR